MENASAQAASKNQFLSALISDGPSLELGDQAETYGWLVGSWDVRVIDYSGDGQKREQQGEWHVSWVLEGRAIQDVFIVPRRELRGTSVNDNDRFGAALRIYDATINMWRVMWNNPVTGAYNELLGRRVDDKIIQEGVDSYGNKFRWIFDNIPADSFHWYGERSHDGGKTWTLEVEFFAIREK